MNATDTIDLAAAATPGDRVHTTRGGFTVSRTVWPDNWRQPVDLEPLPVDLLDALAPAEYRLPSAQHGPPSVFPGGRVYHGATRVTTNGAAPVRRNGADWLRCRLELWDGEGSRQLLRGLVRVDR